MIPFNLERSKQGIPLRTREGVAAKLIAHLSGGQPAPILVEVIKGVDDDDDEDGSLFVQESTMIENYYIDGRHGTVHDSPMDLFMEY